MDGNSPGLRVAVTGMGPIGNRHADIAAADPLVTLVGVCDRDRARATAAGRRLGVPAFTEHGAMLAALAPEICHVSTGGEEYGSDHAEPTLEALEAGCHVLGEKPISNTIEEAERMVACAREARRCYGINLNHRFTPATRLAKAWQEEGRLGSLLFINMSMWIGNPTEASPYFHLKALHPHTVDTMRYFCGDVEAVHCFAMKAPGRSIWSTAQFNLRFASGVVGSLTGSYDIERGHPMERCEVAGTGGRFVIEDMWRELTLYPAGDPVKQVYTNPLFGGFEGFEATFRDRLHTFWRQVSEGAPPEAIEASGADGLAAQRVLAAAIESLEQQRVVQVS